MELSNVVWDISADRAFHTLSLSQPASMLIAPFIQLGAFSKFLDTISINCVTSVVTRWNPDDIVSGVSDLEVFNECTRRGLKLYITNNIHLKMYIFGNFAYVGSSNITDSGLNFKPTANIEAGVVTTLGSVDWKKIYSIVDNCTRVTQSIYDRACEYRDTHKRNHSELPPLFLQEKTKEYSLAMLPSCSHPSELSLLGENPSVSDSSLVCCILHDIIVFGSDVELSCEERVDKAGEGFLKSRFVIALLDELIARRSMSFGQVTSWVHDHCEDVPVPYRSDVKISVQKIYSWLSFFHSAVRVEVPGNKSQVLYWDPPTDQESNQC